MYPRLLQFGHLAIPTYGALIALALIALLAALVYFARRLALDANKIWNLGLIGILTALIAERLLLIVANFGEFRLHPFWVLGLTEIHNSSIIYAAALLGLAAASLYALAEGLPLLHVLDCIAPSAALALVIARAGAFLAGIDYGLPATHGWSITYTNPTAGRWYRTPLGMRLYPVQLYEAIASLAILAILVWWLPRRKQDGELCGAWLFLFGIAGYFLDFYRAIGGVAILRHAAVFAIMVIASAPFLLRRKPGSYTVVDDSPHI